MSDQRDRMLRGEWYQGSDPALVAERRRCQELLDRFNATAAGAEDERHEIARELLGAIGSDSTIMPRLRCDYGSHVRIGSNTFVNYDALLLDCAPVTIGDDVAIGPRVQLLTPLHPVEDPEMRRQGWERAEPIAVGDNAWLGGGVIVSAGVTVGAGAVVGAGSVVTRDLPPAVLAAGNPARVIRRLAS